MRKSAVNTLFSSLTAHAAANLLSASQLRIVCKKSVFPLFQLQFKSESTRRARSEGSKEEALSAPELKKGIKMNVHHSRDTAKKQWSETRTLSLRGLSRLIRTITRSLLIEADSWFKREIWMEALEVSLYYIIFNYVYYIILYCIVLYCLLYDYKVIRWALTLFLIFDLAYMQRFPLSIINLLFVNTASSNII